MKFRSRALTGFLSLWVALSPLKVIADDIDVFVGLSAGSADNPNVLFVLDNTSNWARSSQKWPGGIQQGQAEVRAIKTLVNDTSGLVGPNINMGLMEFVVNGNANDTGGFIRFRVQPMTTEAKASLSNHMQTAYDDITGTREKRNSNTEYGNLFYDIYNYFTGGSTVWAKTTAPSDYVDSSAYTANYTKFKSPLTSTNGCSQTYVVFISNPSMSGPADDTADNKAALAALGGNTSNISLPDLTTTVGAATTTDLGYEASCTRSNKCVTTDYAACSDGTYETCACDTTRYDGNQLCASGTHRYTVSATTTTTPTTYIGNTSCMASFSSSEFATQCATYANGCVANGYLTTCPTGNTYTISSTKTTTTDLSPQTSQCYASVPTSFSSTEFPTCATSGHSCSTSAAKAQTSAAACPSGTQRYMITGGTGSKKKNIGYSTNCVTKQADATTAGYTCTDTTGAAATCNTSSSTSIAALTCPGTYRAYTVQDTYTASNATPWQTSACYGSSSLALAAYSSDARCTGSGVTCSAGSQSSSCPANQYSYNVYGQGVTSSTTSDLGPTTACYSSAALAPTSDYALCSTAGTTCTVRSDSYTDVTTNACSSGTARYMVTGSSSGTTTVTPTGTYSTASNNWLSDEWARFLHNTDVNALASGRQNVKVYTIDVFNAQQNASHTALMKSIADVSNGRYFAAKSESEILNALKQIMTEIQSVNTSFSAASIPLSTSNRTQNLNQVYVGMFRADTNALPRWFGNLKRFAINSTGTDLVDANGASATNTQTGFLSDCAVSNWTTDSGAWWESLHLAIDPSPKSLCSVMPSANTSLYSDLPDGSFVEKGGVAEVIRRGNNPAGSSTWSVNRNIYSRSGSALSTTFSTGDTDVDSFIKGVDINVIGKHTAEQDYLAAIGSTPSSPVRPSVHGDVVHSQPLAVDYGGSIGVKVFYGANDGTYRGVDAATGKEMWAFVAPEFNSKLSRLMYNDEKISFPNVVVSSTEKAPKPKDYFFDGSTGLRQNADNSAVWIYPTQRRGGRMLHAIDVSSSATRSPESPALKWYQGCPNNVTSTDTAYNSTCTSGFEQIGQTWSTPTIAKIKGYSATKYVVIVGGGYDTCEDKDSATPSCGTTKGNVVYVLDAEDGTLLRTFSTTRAVTADVSVLDIDNNGYIDYAYVADLGGNLYRISFIDNPTEKNVLDKDNWTIKRVAYAGDGTRKFMFAPALLFSSPNYVYLAWGSGDREHPLYTNYPFSMTNRAYAFRDDIDAYNSSVTACNLDGDPSADGACVLDNTLNNSCTAPSILPSTNGKKAWRIDFARKGEQAVTRALIIGGTITLNTSRAIDPGENSCARAMGQAGGYWLNLLNGAGAIGVDGTCGGTRYNDFVTGLAMPTPPVVVNIAGLDPVIIGAVPVDGSTGGLFTPSKRKPPVTPKRYRKYQYMKVDN